MNETVETVGTPLEELTKILEKIHYYADGLKVAKLNLEGFVESLTPEELADLRGVFPPRLHRTIGL